jgi:hypothetical protein
MTLGQYILPIALVLSAFFDRFSSLAPSELVCNLIHHVCLAINETGKFPKMFRTKVVPFSSLSRSIFIAVYYLINRCRSDI